MSAITSAEFQAATEEVEDAFQLYTSWGERIDADTVASIIRHWFAALPQDVKLVRREPLDAMLEASIKASGAWVEPYRAPRESGVPTGCDILEEDAAFINAEQMESARQECRVMFDTAPPSLPEE